MRIAIEKIVYPGRSLALFEGKTVLTDEGLPGELVEVEPTKEKKNLIEARTIRVLERSARRTVPRCSHYMTCSPYQTAAYPYQIEVKKSQVEEILGSLWDFDKKDADFVPSPKIWNYRNRTRMRVLWEGRRPSLAYVLPGTRNKYVKIEECHLVSKAANELLAAVLDVVSEKQLRSLREIEARVSWASGALLLALFWTEAPKPTDIDSIISGPGTRFPVRGIVSIFRAKTGFLEKTEWGENFIEEKVRGATFMIGARSFFQVNIDMLDSVIEDIEAWAGFKGSERLADLYGGLGTFGIVLAGRVAEVYGVESDAANIFFLKKNIALNGTANYRIHEGQGEEWTSLILAKRMDVVIVDPPRKGLEPATLRLLIENPAARIFYLSCNPSTLARDLKELRTAYEITSLRGYDFFPQTPHIEVLAGLERKPRETRGG